MDITTRLQQICQQIYAAEQTYQRSPGGVSLLAVSKQQSVAAIRTALAAGQRCFGESYLKEALPKMAALVDSSIEWHFIGKLQANKTKLIAQHFSWVHSVDRLEIAQRLNAQRKENLPPLNTCIAVNISQQPSKSGVSLEKLPQLAQELLSLKNLRLRGLMAIPEPSQDFGQQVRAYRQLQQAQFSLCASGFILDTLSMGMSHDFVAAIAAGSTMVRIGTGLFGRRPSKNE